MGGPFSLHPMASLAASLPANSSVGWAISGSRYWPDCCFGCLEEMAVWLFVNMRILHLLLSSSMMSRAIKMPYSSPKYTADSGCNRLRMGQQQLVDGTEVEDADGSGGC